MQKSIAGNLRKKINEEEHINIQIYYPLVILQGPLYSATLKNDSVNYFV
jgi:hypothetical protein